jgi:hypothetical protein
LQFLIFRSTYLPQKQLPIVLCHLLSCRVIPYLKIVVDRKLEECFLESQIDVQKDQGIGEGSDVDLASEVAFVRGFHFFDLLAYFNGQLVLAELFAPCFDLIFIEMVSFVHVADILYQPLL